MFLISKEKAQETFKFNHNRIAKMEYNKIIAFTNYVCNFISICLLKNLHNYDFIILIRIEFVEIFYLKNLSFN